MVTISVNAKKRTITVGRSTAIGMIHDDLDLDNLRHHRTLCRSTAFVEQMTGDETKDMGLIGQFGRRIFPFLFHGRRQGHRHLDSTPASDIRVALDFRGRRRIHH